MFYRYGQSPGLIMIRWSLQHGYITIPKASSAEHIEGNTKVFGWSIHEEDMAALVNSVRNFNAIIITKQNFYSKNL